MKHFFFIGVDAFCTQILRLLTKKAPCQLQEVEEEDEGNADEEAEVTKTSFFFFFFFLPLFINKS